MDETVAWALAAFMSNRDADEGALVELLTSHGVPLARAGYAVVMLPLAFGRRLLGGIVKLPDEVRAGERTVLLASDPVFTAASDRASYAMREEMMAVALRSSEVNAVNSALHSGSRPEDLSLAVTMIPDLGEVGPDPAWASTALGELVRSHGSKLAFSTRVFPRELVAGGAQLQLDVVVSAGPRTVIESFAGNGDTIAAATQEALAKFAQSSLHVLLAVLENEQLGGDQVEWEDWGEWRACLGPLLRQWSDAAPVDFSAYLDALRTKLVSGPLTPELHWFRTFIAIGDQILGHDALLDNMSWPAGVELLTTWPWPREERPYALRHFLALLPARN